jgi:type II secretory pathway pseudopilin PulG
MKKRAITLLEIMIVILLIGIIGSVVGYNMKGSLDKGRAFKTKQAQEQIKSVLLLQANEHSVSLQEAVNQAKDYLTTSPLVKNADDLMKDGWGNSMDIKVVKNEANNTEEIEVISDRLIKYEKEHNVDKQPKAEAQLQK